MKKMEIVITDKERILMSIANDDKYLFTLDMNSSEFPEEFKNFLDMFNQMVSMIEENESE